LRALCTDIIPIVTQFFQDTKLTPLVENLDKKIDGIIGHVKELLKDSQGQESASKLEAELNELRGVQCLITRIEELTAENSGLNNQIERLTGEVQAEAKARKLFENREDLVKDKEKKQLEYDIQTKVVENLESTDDSDESLAKVLEELAKTHRVKVKSLEGKIKKFNALVQLNQSSITLLKQEKEDLEGKVEDLQSKVDKAARQDGGGTTSRHYQDELKEYENLRQNKTKLDAEIKAFTEAEVALRSVAESLGKVPGEEKAASVMKTKAEVKKQNLEKAESDRDQCQQRLEQVRMRLNSFSSATSASAVSRRTSQSTVLTVPSTCSRCDFAYTECLKCGMEWAVEEAIAGGAESALTPK
jgi:chromosome segregation ATPase